MCVRESHKWRISVKNIFSIEKNQDIDNLKDIGKTLITNYMYNVPLIKIVFITFNMKCSTKLFFNIIQFNSWNYLNGLSSILLNLAFIFNFQQAMHIKLHIQSRNTGDDWHVLTKIQTSKRRRVFCSCIVEFAFILKKTHLIYCCILFMNWFTRCVNRV